MSARTRSAGLKQICHHSYVRAVGGWAALLLCGCTALNGDFDPSASVGGTGSGGASGSSDAGVDTTTSSTDVGGAGTTGDDIDPTGATGTTGHASSSSTGGDPDVRVPTEPVMLIYAAPGWSGNSAAMLPPPEALFDHCVMHRLDRCDVEIDPVPLVRTNDDGFSGVLIDLGILGNDPVYAGSGDGTRLIATGLLTLFTENLIHSLADAGVDTHGEQQFWSGGFDDAAMANCNNWSASGSSVGMVGRFDLVEFWFDDETLECDDALPILCVCESIPNAFGV